MYKTTDRTKQFVRFLREMGIKYIFSEETLQNEYIKKYANKEFSKLLDGDTNGNLLKYFDKFFSLGFYSVMGISFSWVNSKNGCDFWAKMEYEWIKMEAELAKIERELCRTHK